jgi:hypothetical protein
MMPVRKLKLDILCRDVLRIEPRPPREDATPRYRVSEWKLLPFTDHKLANVYAANSRKDLWLAP